MKKFIRYSANNRALYIGGQHNKLAIFTKGKFLIRLHLGNRLYHFGDWGL